MFTFCGLNDGFDGGSDPFHVAVELFLDQQAFDPHAEAADVKQYNHRTNMYTQQYTALQSSFKHLYKAQQSSYKQSYKAIQSTYKQQY